MHCESMAVAGGKALRQPAAEVELPGGGGKEGEELILTSKHPEGTVLRSTGEKRSETWQSPIPINFVASTTKSFETI